MKKLLLVLLAMLALNNFGKAQSAVINNQTTCDIFVNLHMFSPNEGNCLEAETGYLFVPAGTSLTTPPPFPGFQYAGAEVVTDAADTSCYFAQVQVPWLDCLDPADECALTVLYPAEEILFESLSYPRIALQLCGYS